jgi:GNAT superfamily N-acetyltransferase
MVRVRPAEPKDVPLIRQLIAELAEYERAPEEAIASDADLLRDGFGPEPRYFCLIAESDGEPAGFALYFKNYSTWQGKWGLYLEDLFVRPRLRKQGAGKALLVELARVAVGEGCGRFEWAVLDWNTPAIDFYQKLGARPLREWIRMRLEGDALQKLASGLT